MMENISEEKLDDVDGMHFHQKSIALSHCLFETFQRELRLKRTKIIRTFHWGKKTQPLPIPRCCCDNS